MTYEEFIQWLDRTPVSQLFKETSWVVPAVQSVHILGIAVVLAGCVVLSLRLVGLNARHVDIPALAERLIPSMWWAILALLATGTLLIIAEPTRTLNNPYFFLKMACLVLLLPLIRSFQLSARKQPQRWSASSVASVVVSPAVAVGMTLLIVIIFCGRWIAYV